MTDVLNSKLLPCPFCGGPADILVDGRKTYVACMDGDECGAEGHRALVDAYAVERWNTRSLSAPTPTEVGEVVGWVGYWPSTGSIESVTGFTRFRDTMERWVVEGAEITPVFDTPKVVEVKQITPSANDLQSS